MIVRITRSLKPYAVLDNMNSWIQLFSHIHTSIMHLLFGVVLVGEIWRCLADVHFEHKYTFTHAFSALM